VRPLIGISSYARGGQRLSFSVPCEYVDAIRRAGGVPVVLPPVLGPVREALDVVSALIFPGGGDIHPEHYGGNDHDANYGTCHERDAFELVMARAALDRDMPIMCVCRGMQVLNVALGGDLISHIPDLYGTQVIHRTPEVQAITHPVRIDPKSHLARVYGDTSATVFVRWHGPRTASSKRSNPRSTRSSSRCNGTPSSTSTRTSRRSRCSTSS
jgi:putative glutamine amidotransferase